MHNACTMQEDKRKLSIWVPASLYDRVLEAGYTSPTHAVIKGFEKLLQEDTGENTEAMRSQVQAEIKSLTAENQRLRESLDNAPNLTEFIELRARSQEMQRHNETLKSELERAGRDKEFIQTVYDNYMRQMQLLITQKVISPPSSTDKGVDITVSNDMPASRDADISIYRDADVNTSTDSDKFIIEKHCKNCKTLFKATNPKQAYCSGACRTAYNRKQKKLN